MTNALIKLEVSNGLARLTLANPAAGNVLNMAAIEELAQAVERLKAQTPRAVLLRAEGKNFCVGGDIRSFSSAPDRGALLEQMAGRLHESVAALAALPAPVIAVVQGAAAGAGLSLVAGADLVLAGRNANFTMAYTGIAFSPDGGATYFLPRLIGLRRTQEMALTNRRLSAEEALQWGLVTKVVDDDQLAAEGEALAQRIAAGPSFAFGAVKKLLNDGATRNLVTQLAAETQAIAATARSEDAGEGLAAFLERRPSKFKGY